MDRWRRNFDGAGVEERRQHRELVVLAFELVRLTGLERGEHCPQALHVVAQARARCRRPRRRVAPLVVPLHLGADAELEATVRQMLQVPRELRRHHRAARKGDGDVGRQLDPLGVLGRDSDRQERIVPRFGRRQVVEAQRFHLARGPGVVADTRCRLSLPGVLLSLEAQQDRLDFQAHRAPPEGSGKRQTVVCPRSAACYKNGRFQSKCERPRRQVGDH